jgi:hypothetical protein
MWIQKRTNIPSHLNFGEVLYQMAAARTDELERALVRTVTGVPLGTSNAGINVGIRIQPVLDWTARLSREAARAVASMLSPAAAISLVLGFWRLGADLGWTGKFAISEGLFSHWQVWLAMAIVLEALSSTILRNGQKPQSREQH